MGKIISIKKIKNEYNIDKHRTRQRIKTVYDIEVKDNHNYLANDMLVSNSSAKTYQDLNKKKFANIYYRLGLTATKYRSDGSDMEMDAVLSDVVYELSIQDAIKQGYLIEPYFIMDEFKQTTTQKQWQKVYKECIVENVERNQLIAKRAKYCKSKGLHTLILVKELKHGELLQSMIPGSVFIHGKLEDREELLDDFRKGNIHTVIATSLIGEGVDIPIISAIINAQALKAEGDLIQKIGRALRLYKGKKKALMFDIYDKGQKMLQKQAKQRLNVYKKNYTGKIKVKPIS